jgi:hypothetical protein
MKMAKRFKSLPLIRITRQGAPVVNAAWAKKCGNNVALVLVDLMTKHCEVSCHYSDPESRGDVGLRLKETGRTPRRSRKGIETEITFPAFRGWDVFCAGCCKYSLKVVLTGPGLDSWPASRVRLQIL